MLSKEGSLVLCDETRERMEEWPENWRGCLEDAGLKVSVSKTEHLLPTLNLQKNKDERVWLRKFNWSVAGIGTQISETTINQEGWCGTGTTRRIEKGWNTWKDLAGVLCDKKILKVPLYKMAIKTTLMCGNDILKTRRQDKCHCDEELRQM